MLKSLFVTSSFKVFFFFHCQQESNIENSCFHLLPPSCSCNPGKYCLHNRYKMSHNIEIAWCCSHIVSAFFEWAVQSGEGKINFRPVLPVTSKSRSGHQVFVPVNPNESNICIMLHMLQVPVMTWRWEFLYPFN